MVCPKCESYMGKVVENKVEIENKPNGEVLLRTSKHIFAKCYKCHYTETTDLKEEEGVLPF